MDPPSLSFLIYNAMDVIAASNSLGKRDAKNKIILVCVPVTL